MTVAELIEYLSKLDQTLPVVLTTPNDGYWLMTDSDMGVANVNTYYELGPGTTPIVHGSCPALLISA